MLIVALIFGNKVIQDFLHVPTNIRTGVLIDREGGRGMLDKQMQEPDFREIEA